jgi:hypothetical protein
MGIVYYCVNTRRKWQSLLYIPQNLKYPMRTSLLVYKVCVSCPNLCHSEASLINIFKMAEKRLFNTSSDSICSLWILHSLLTVFNVKAIKHFSSLLYCSPCVSAFFNHASYSSYSNALSWQQNNSISFGFNVQCAKHWAITFNTRTSPPPVEDLIFQGGN